MIDTTWHEQAVCRTADPELFFPADSESAQAAVAICRTCPVINECLTAALENREEHGVFGGTTRKQRVAMIRRQKRLRTACRAGHTFRTGSFKIDSTGARRCLRCDRISKRHRAEQGAAA